MVYLLSLLPILTLVLLSLTKGVKEAVWGGAIFSALF